MILSHTAWIALQVLLFATRVILGKLFNISMPQVALSINSNNNSTYLIGLLGGLNELGL